MAARSGRECPVCGHPPLRPDAHAPWCERVTRALAADERFYATHCPQGHLHDDSNTGVHPVTGGRVCLDCRSAA